MPPMALARPGFSDTGKFDSADLPGSIRSPKGGKRTPVAAVGVELGVVALFRRAEGALDHRVVVEERQEDRDALDNRGAQLVLDAQPVVLEPAFDGFQDLPLHRVGCMRAESQSGTRIRSRP